MNQKATGRALGERPQTSEPLGFNGTSIRFKQLRKEAASESPERKNTGDRLVDNEPRNGSWYFKPKEFSSRVPPNPYPPPGAYIFYSHRFRNFQTRTNIYST